jgi:hypothetical protein
MYDSVELLCGASKLMINGVSVIKIFGLMVGGMVIGVYC